MKPVRMTKEDRQWRAERDINTLKQADEIRANASIMKAAEKFARELIDSVQKTVQNNKRGK